MPYLKQKRSFPWSQATHKLQQRNSMRMFQQSVWINTYVIDNRHKFLMETFDQLLFGYVILQKQIMSLRKKKRLKQ